jgi:hypothetical protein
LRAPVLGAVAAMERDLLLKHINLDRRLLVAQQRQSSGRCGRWPALSVPIYSEF